MPTVKVGDHNIYYEVHGKGEPLLLIMGYGGSSELWFRQIPYFSQEYQVIAFDNRGAGRSDKPDVPYTMQTFAQDTAGLLEALAIDAAHIYGNSMGGMIAQEFALLYPEKVISLVLGCTNCGGHRAIPPEQETMHILDVEHMQQLTPEEQALVWGPIISSQEFIDNNPDIAEQFMARFIKYLPPLHARARQTEAIMAHNTYDRLPQIKAHTLVIAGDADRLVPPENSGILASRIPNAELVILENVRHGFFMEGAEEANTVILDFLRRHRRSRQEI